MLKIESKVPKLASEKYLGMTLPELKNAISTYKTTFRSFSSWGLVLTGRDISRVASYIMRLGKSNLGILGDKINGRKIYGLNCVACHGDSGRGDGILASLLEVKILDFATKKQLEISDDLLLRAIVSGKGTFMPPWIGELSSDQIRDVAAYVRSLAMPQ